jgi:L-asparaginase II
LSVALVEVWRGNMVECLHRGDVAVSDNEGRLLASAGDPRRVTYLRSSAKPLQAMAVVESGAADRFGITPQELAAMCGSHRGRPEHTTTVAGILAKVGLGPDALQCGAHRPVDQSAADALARAGESPGPLHNNCSGKHAGMLVLARHLGCDIAGYRDPAHPVQRRLLELVADMAGVDPATIGLATDGCGVPVFAMPLLAAAFAFARLAEPAGLPPERAAAARRVAAAVQAHPAMVSGPGGFDTVVMEELPGRLVSKGGAEGVQCLALQPQGWGVVLKIDDGAGRAPGPAALETVRQLGWDACATPRLAGLLRPALRNVRDDEVGHVTPSFELLRCGRAACAGA